MNMASEIGAVCSKSNNAGRGVMPPQVCPYCFECPIATIVAGVSGNNQQRGPLDIPDDHVQEIRDWLRGIEDKIAHRV